MHDLTCADMCPPMPLSPQHVCRLSCTQPQRLIPSGWSTLIGTPPEVQESIIEASISSSRLQEVYFSLPVFFWFVRWPNAGADAAEEQVVGREGLQGRRLCADEHEAQGQPLPRARYLHPQLQASAASDNSTCNASTAIAQTCPVTLQHLFVNRSCTGRQQDAGSH